MLPVQWRASLMLDQEKTTEDKEHGMDNRFRMEDITINKSIPYVRELTNSVGSSGTGSGPVDVLVFRSSSIFPSSCLIIDRR